jgi:leucyl aminopeptidase (aminopeptidase T)
MATDTYELHGALAILDTCLALRMGQGLLVAFDKQNKKRAETMVAAARRLGVAVSSGSISERCSRNPPAPVAKKMAEADVSLFCVDERKTLHYGHSDARKKACEAGSRVAFLTQGLAYVPEKRELVEIHDRTARLADLLERTSTLVIKSGARRKETLRLALGKERRRAVRLSSILTEPGSWGAVPDYAEAAVAPVERNSVGSLTVDGTIVGMGQVRAPVTLEFKEGELAGASGNLGRRLEGMLGQSNRARTLCEVGFGTNHLRKVLKGEFDDKKMLGSVHVGLGDNHTIGGVVRSRLHIDCLVRRPTVSFDGRGVDLSAV